MIYFEPLPDPLRAFLACQGQFASLDYMRPMKLRAAHKGAGELSKVVYGRAVQVGADYNKRARTIEAREAGAAPSEPQGLPWGRWVDFPYLIEHKGAYYLRFYDAGRDKRQAAVGYYFDGAEISEGRARELAPVSEFKPSPLCFVVREEHVLDVRGGGV